MVSGARAASSAEAQKAEEARDHFSTCLVVMPQSWQCMWAMGKACQLLGEQRVALGWFERALMVERGNPDVFREAAAEALALGEAAKAVQYAEEAQRLRPVDAGLQANLALAYMLAGRDGAAVEAAERAHSENPADVKNKKVLALVVAVRDGQRKRPTSL